MSTDQPPDLTGPPQGSAHSRGEQMRSLARELREYQAALDSFDEAISELLKVNRTDLRCLDLLSLHHRLTAGALAKASGVTTGAITFLIDRMERAGFVRRSRDEQDRRKVMVEMHPDAQSLAWKLHQPLVEEMRARFAQFGRGELDVIRQFLQLGREVYEHHASLLKGRDLDSELDLLAHKIDSEAESK